MARTPLRFRLYPEKARGLYVLVTIWATRKEMLTASHLSPRHRRGTQATCGGIEVISYRKGRARKLPVFAEANFHRARLGTEVVSHEMFHATAAWGRRVAFKWPRLGDDDHVNDDEERMAYVHGRLCRQLVQRAIDAGIYGAAPQ